MMMDDVKIYMLAAMNEERNEFQKSSKSEQT